MIGETIQNRYKIERELGRGGMGTVYRAYDTLLKRDVAIKVLNLEGIDKESRDRLLREAQFSAKLNHPNIVTTFDVGDSDGSPFIVMEYVEGCSLYEYKPEDFEEIISFARSICAALEHAHNHSIVHRDLKPENVLLTREGDVKLMDFGLARPTASRLTVEGQISGTVYYLAPELIKGQEYDGRADLYAFGIILYELLTGELPFKGENPVAVVSQHLNEDVVPPVDIDPDIPSHFNQMILDLLQKEPGDRPASAGDLLKVLDRLDQPTIEEIPLEVEGKQKPEPRPKQPEFLEEDASDRKPPPLFVAKERQLNKLDNYLETALEGEGKVIFVCGGPGRGKTALIDEFARRAMLEHPELLVTKGSCNAISGIGDAYLPFREIMAMLGGDVVAQWKAGAVTTEHARRLWRAVPILVGALLEWGPNLLETFLSGNTLLQRSIVAVPERGDMFEALTREVERSKRIPEGLDQSHLFEQFTNVLCEMADDYPLLLILDDMHWADTASTSLLFHLGRRITTDRIMVVGAYRPEELALGWEGKRHPLEKILSEFTLLFGDIKVDLAEEGEAEGLQFVEALLDSEPNLLDDSFQQALYAHTGGHPLFTIELLRSLQDRGELLLDDGGYWIAGPAVDWESLPARVEAVIAERISRLEGELREILAVASVEGEDFTAQIVAQVQGISERRVLRMLSGDLEKRHRLVRELSVMHLGHQQISRYRFTHALFQQYLYQDLSYRERNLLKHAMLIGYRWKRSENVVKCCSAKTVVGTSRATCLPSLTAINEARRATSVFPYPTSPHTSRSIEIFAFMSLYTSSMAKS